MTEYWFDDVPGISFAYIGEAQEVYGDGLYYTPFVTADGRAGHRVASLGTGGEVKYVYLNPSNGDQDRNVFLYEGTECDPNWDYPHHFYEIGYDWSRPEEDHGND